MDIPKITEAEYEIMKILWNSEKAVSSVDIIEYLNKEKGWNKSTTLTLIGRLLEKGAINTSEKKGKAYCYIAIIPKQEYIQSETMDFMKRIHGGRIKNLIASLVGSGELSEDEVNELRNMLKDRK